MQTKPTSEIRPTDRVLVGGMEWEVKGVEPIKVENTMTGQYEQFLQLHLDDQLETNVNGEKTGELSIIRELTAEIEVLEPGEKPPQTYWHD